MADLIDRDAAIRMLSDYAETQQDLYYYRDMLMEIPAVNRWISVEDAFPEIKEFNISDTVLCYCDSGALAIARLEENAFGQVGFNCEKDDEYHLRSEKVLYWMPIPEIPEPPEKE